MPNVDTLIRQMEDLIQQVKIKYLYLFNSINSILYYSEGCDDEDQAKYFREELEKLIEEVSEGD